MRQPALQKPTLHLGPSARSLAASAECGCPPSPTAQFLFSAPACPPRAKRVIGDRSRDTGGSSRPGVAGWWQEEEESELGLRSAPCGCRSDPGKRRARAPHTGP